MSSQLPRDEEGFVQSFSLDQVDEYLAFFREHGLVVLRNALTPDEVDETLDEIWTNSALLGRSGEIERDDPTTWGEENWPDGGKGGFVDPIDQMRLVAAWKNRQNPRLYNLFKNILGKEQLWVKIDRFGVLRPTVGVQLPDGTTVDHPEWRSEESWLHWDQNPWLERGFVRVQGILALTDSTDTSGGFLAIPGFQHRFAQWAADSEKEHANARPLVRVPKDDPMQSEPQKIPMRAGSMVIWDSRLPHQNYPNRDSTLRIVQYVTFEYYEPENAEKRKGQQELSLKRRLSFGTDDDPECFPGLLTPLGLKLVGLKLWDEADEAPYVAPEREKDPNKIKAVRLMEQAEEAEVNNDVALAQRLYAQAFKLDPSLGYSS